MATPTEHPHGSLVEQVHRVITTDQGVDAWVIAEEAVKFVESRTKAQIKEAVGDHFLKCIMMTPACLDEVIDNA